MRQAKRVLLLLLGALVVILSAASVLGWEQSNDRDWAGGRNLGIRLYGNTITMSLEQDGSFDISDGSDLTAIRNAFATINGISTSDATVEEGSTFDYPANIDSEAGYSWSDGVNRIYFFNVDSDDSFDALAAAAVYYDQYTGLILGSPGWPNRGGCDIAVNNLDYTWSTTTPDDPNELLPENTYDIQSVLTHEMMHCFGFEHTAIVGAFDPTTGLEVSGFTSGDYSFHATLFPYASRNIQQRTLSPDDVAAFSDVYPSASASTSFGQISGRILRPDGSGVKGAHVVAVLAAEPTHPVVGRLSGIEADTDPGGYRLTGLAPGNYYVRIEPLTGTTNPFTEDNTGFVGFDTTFAPEFYSGADESAVDTTIAATDAAVVTVVAGATVRDVNIIVNPASVGAALNFLPARLAFVGVQGGADPAAQSFTIKTLGAESPCWRVSGNPSWLSVSPGNGTLTTSGDLVTVSANLSGLAPDTYLAKLAVQAIGADNSAQAVSVILVVAPSTNTIRSVCSSGCDYISIQSAIDAASSGDIVQVGTGHYLEHIVMKAGVKLVGAGSGSSVIDGGGSGVVVTAASNALLDGFTIMGGRNDSVVDVGSYAGGGISCVNVLDTEVSHNAIQYNEIPDGFGAGAGLYARASRISILDNVFRINAAGYFDVFSSTASGGQGGAIAIYNQSDPSGQVRPVTIARNRIIDNLSGEGGGIKLYTSGSHNTYVTDNLIAKNQVVAGIFPGSTGGGISLVLSSPAVDRITNNTIADNFNSVLAGWISGINCYFSAPAAITNNIIWGHRVYTGEEYVGEEISLCPAAEYSTVDGGFSGTGNSSSDPLFRDRLDYDYHLLPSSSAIDAGSNSAPSISSNDLAGVPRVMDGNSDGTAVADMGAYEYGAPPPPPAVSWEPRGGLSFPAQRLNTTSSGSAVTLTNSGFSALTITSLDIAGTQAGDFAESDDCPLSPDTLGADAFCTINVTFTPTASGPRKSTLLLASDAPDSPHRIMLTGLGTAIGFSPSSVDFPSQQAGTVSTPQTVTLHNYGSDPVHVWSSALGGANSTEFTHINDCPVPPATLAKEGSCTVSVRFSPASEGAKGAALLISHDGGGSPRSVGLTGSATAAGASSEAALSSVLTPDVQSSVSSPQSGTPVSAGGQARSSVVTVVLAVVPLASGEPAGSVSFGSLPVGRHSAPSTIMVRNAGPAPFSLTSLAITGPSREDFKLTSHCPASLRPDGACSLELVFTPHSSGPRGAQLTVDYGTSGERHVDLDGLGQE